MEVFVADLLKDIVSKNSDAVVRWLCVVRDLDAPGDNKGKVSKACDAVLQTLMRFFLARYITRSVLILEAFSELFTACTDLTIDGAKRWQRVCNVCAFLIPNISKSETVHVYPLLKSPLLELDDVPEKCQSIPAAATTKKHLTEYVQNLCVSPQCPYVTAWLDTDPLRCSHETADVLKLFSSCLKNRNHKKCNRIISFLVATGKEICTSRFNNIFEVMWHIVSMHAADVSVDSVVKRYVDCCESLFFCLFPTKRNGRICRLALLYYAVLVLCENRVKTDRPFQQMLNLPVTVPQNMQYLSIFPKLR